MLVTTSYDPSEEQLAQAKRLAAELRARLVSRRHASVRKLVKLHHDAELLIVTDEGVKYVRGEEAPFFYHPSMAMVRIKRLAAGSIDPLVELAQLRPGDRIIDCTAGLGSDALVFSYAGGTECEVTALETEPILYTLVREGLASYVTELDSLNEAMRRIRLLQEHHLAYLRRQPDRSADIVYFDPMFRRPVHTSSSIEPLRHLANPAALDPEAVREACRVARRTVLLKEHRDSAEFERLGFPEVYRKANNIAYGVIHL
ncbi:class I SAM-dependent methyltransferase [Paenibacillus sp. y28]|uniref:class I SAM-dependent methyltransferase n=1 Tax=Paenibacillus sp. y28 TaxID=3129110 RepID=UPI0030181655